MRECLVSQHPSVPEECFRLRTSFFECKRSLVIHTINTSNINNQLNHFQFFFYSWIHGKDFEAEKMYECQTKSMYQNIRESIL